MEETKDLLREIIKNQELTIKLICYPPAMRDKLIADLIKASGDDRPKSTELGDYVPGGGGI